MLLLPFEHSLWTVNTFHRNTNTQFLCSCTMDVLSPTNSLVVCIGCLHRRRTMLLGPIPHQETLDENVFAKRFLREFHPGL